MSTFDKLLAAEFRGISFLVESEETSEGRKIAVHEYVNNSKRFVEDLGELPSTFTVSAFVHGDDAIQQANNLRVALSNSTQGSLTLPHFGTFDVKAGPYSVQTKMTAVGRVNFKLTFYLSEAGIFPVSQDSTSANLGAKSDLTRDGVSENLGDNMNVPQSATTQDLTEGKVLDATTLWDDMVSTASGATDLIAESGRIIGEIRSNVSALVRGPEILAARINDLYNNFTALTLQLDSISPGLFFGDDDIDIPPTTPDRVERKQNVDLFNDFIKVNTIISLLEQSSAQEFETNDQLTTVLDRIQLAYDEVRESDILLIEPVVEGAIEEDNFNESSIDSSASDAVIDNFNSVRDIGIRLLEAKEQSTSQVTDLDIIDTSISILTYQLYGDIDRIDSLAKLNLDQDLSNMSVSAKVLSD